VQYRAAVEFAPFQKGFDPSKKQRVDQRMGTLKEDEDYKAFLDSFTKPEALKELDLMVDPKDIEYILSSKKNDGHSQLTPLLLSIKNEKAKKAARKNRSSAASASGLVPGEGDKKGKLQTSPKSKKGGSAAVSNPLESSSNNDEQTPPPVPSNPNPKKSKFTLTKKPKAI
jgi:hypothetical protein